MAWTPSVAAFLAYVYESWSLFISKIFTFKSGKQGTNTVYNHSGLSQCIIEKIQVYNPFYKKHFYMQHQLEIDKKSKSYAKAWGRPFTI